MRHLDDFLLERAQPGLYRCRQMRDFAEFGVEAGGKDHALAMAGEDRSSGEGQIRNVERMAVGDGIGRPSLRFRFAGERGVIDAHADGCGGVSHRQESAHPLPARAHRPVPVRCGQSVAVVRREGPRRAGSMLRKA